MHSLLCALTVLLTAAVPHETSAKNTEVSSSHLSAIRLAQVKQQFAEMPNEENRTLANDGNTIKPMTPLSLNPLSGCVFSACGASGCVLSGCGGSACAGSGCVGSVCGGSACQGSTCVSSKCGGSVCVGSLCGKSTCSGRKRCK